MYVTCEGVCECVACPPGTTNEAGYDKDCDACAQYIGTCLTNFLNDLTCSDNTGGATDTAGDGCEWSLRGVRKFVNQVENVLFF